MDINKEGGDKPKRGRKPLPEGLRKMPKYSNTGMIEYVAKKGNEIPPSFVKNIDEINENNKKIILSNKTVIKNKNKKLFISDFYEHVSKLTNYDVELIEKVVNFRTQMIKKLIGNAYEGKILFKEFFTFEPDYFRLRYIIKSGKIFDNKYDDIRDKILSDSFLKGIDLTKNDISIFLNNNVVEENTNEEDYEDDNTFYEEL